MVVRQDSARIQRYRYDGDNRLVGAKGDGPKGLFEAQYHYDALGRRLSKSVSTRQERHETHFLWQGLRLLQSRTADSQQTYCYDPNEAYTPLACIERRYGEDQLYWYHTDLNGSPQEVTNKQGDMVWSGQYGVFGQVTRQTEAMWRNLSKPLGQFRQLLRYAGQYLDEETGLHYNTYRYYAPEVGRFITPDPIGLLGGLNLYQYAPNPLSWIDPLGLYKGEGQRDLGKYHVFHEHTLNSAEYTMTDKEHFSRANESVYKRLQVDAEFKRELQTKYPGVVEHVQPMSNGNFRGSSPKGMTWHHGDKSGSLQLADFNDHRTYHKVYHPDGTGGRNKWGGGTKCRK